MIVRSVSPFAIAAMLLASSAGASAQATRRARIAPSDYLYLWASSTDSTGPDFLAVYDVRDRQSADRYGTLVATLPVPGGRHRTHHTEHTMPVDGQLFANEYASGQSYVFDLSAPTAPRLVKQFGNVGALMHPHSFWRLPNGNVLATFQMQHDSLGVAPGGLVELTPRGDVVRASLAGAAGVDRRIRPYSAAILPAVGRVVVTTSAMGDGDTTRAVQLWRLSDLSLERTIELPGGPRGDEGYLSAEPRVLEDGKRVLVSTFNCGLYLLDRLETAAPRTRFVASFPRKEGTDCAIPVVAGRYYLITVPAWNAVVSLDISDPTRPREVSRLSLGSNDVPHWIGIEPDHRRVVITGYRAMKTRVLIARFDERTGKLTLDKRFRAAGSAEPGLRLEGVAWPHGGNGAAVPHGAVFSRPTAASADSVFDVPEWMFPTPTSANAHAEVDTLPLRVPNSARAFTRAQVSDRFAAVDWHPATHSPMPEVVVRGRKPAVFACAFCHLPDGGGRPENASLAGLPVAYIEQQLAAMASGARQSARSTYVGSVLMNQVAQAATPAEVRSAAEYFSRIRVRQRSRVIEGDTIPRVQAGLGLYFAHEAGGTERLGRRLIEMATDQTRHELRDAAVPYVTYVPRGSIARGRALAMSVTPTVGQSCVGCHGVQLRGLGDVPSLAGRSPSSLLRQLVGFRTGARSGPAAAPMRAVVAELDIEDMIALAAYAGSRTP